MTNGSRTADMFAFFLSTVSFLHILQVSLLHALKLSVPPRWIIVATCLLRATRQGGVASRSQPSLAGAVPCRACGRTLDTGDRTAGAAGSAVLSLARSSICAMISVRLGCRTGARRLGEAVWHGSGCRVSAGAERLALSYRARGCV